MIINAPLTLQDTALAMGTSAGTPSITQNITIKKDITATRLLTGNGKDTTTNVKHDNGTITLTHNYTGPINETTTNPAVLLGHWPSNTHYQLNAGAIVAENGWLALGWGNNSHGDQYNTEMYVGQSASDAGETTARVVVYGMDGRDRNNKATIQVNQTGTLSIGEGGVNLNQQKKHLILSGGTLEAYQTMVVQNLPNGLELKEASTLQANDNCDMRINVSIVDVEGCSSSLAVKGDGNVIFAKNNTYGGGTTIEKNATLRLTEEGTLGNGSVTIKSGGTLSYCRSATPTNAISGAGAIVADGEGVELDLCSATLTDFNGALNATGGATIKLPYAMTEGKTFSADGTSKLIVVLSNDETDQNNLNAVTVTGSGTLEFVDAAGHTLPSSDSTYVLPTYTVTDDGGSWNVAPLQHSKAVIDFAETTGKMVDLASILGNVTALTKVTVIGSNGGTITDINATVTACPTVVVTAGGRTNVPATLTSLATTVTGPMAEGSLLYVTGETTSTAQTFPYTGKRHFEKIKFMGQDNVGSGIENYTIAANETMLFTQGNVRYITALTLDGGLLKTSGSNQAWFGGATNKCLTVKAGIADLTSVITDNGSSAVLIGYSSNHTHLLDIQGGLLDASKTSIVGWEEYSKYSQSGGLVKTKGFRQNDSNFTEMTLTGGTIELGAGGIPDLGMASVTLGAATIRATADATITEALNVTGAATLQAVAGKTLTVSGTISGDGTIAIGGTGTTKTRADDGTYTDATVNATGIVYIGTNRPKIASIAEGATLQIALTDAELENGISWTVGENLTAEDANRLTVVGATLDNITIAGGVLTANLASSLAASWENGVWSKTPVDGAPITITFSEGYTTCTFTNTEAIKLASLTIKGATAGEIVLGDYAVTVDAMTVEPTEVTIPVALFNSFAAQAYTVESGKTLKLKGDADVSKTMTVSGTLVIEGSMNFTNAANAVASGATLEVVSGVTTFNAAEQGIKGTLTIDKGATFKNVRGADALAYDTNGVVVNVYGTLDMGSTRWTIFANKNTINAYAGATIAGEGQSNNGALDVWREKDTNTGDHVAINVLKNGEDASDVTISATIRYRSKETIFDVAEGMTANLTGTNADVNTIEGGLKVKGAGTLKLCGKNAYASGVGVTVESDATLIVAHAEALSAPVTNSGTLELNAAGVEATIAQVISGAGVVNVKAGTWTLTGANTYNGATTIEEGAKVVANSGTSSTWDFKNAQTDAEIKVLGDLEISSTGELYRGFNGTGNIIINADSVIIGNTGDAGVSGLTNFRGNLVVNSGKKLIVRTWNSNAYTMEMASVTVNGTLERDGGHDPRISLTTAKLSGSGVITTSKTERPLSLPLANGAIIDATKGAVTVNGAVTLPETGTVTVKVTNYGDVLKATGLDDASKFSLEEGIAGQLIATSDALVYAPVIPPAEGETAVSDAVMAEVARAAGAEKVTTITAVLPRTIVDENDEEILTVDVNGAELFNNVISFENDGTSEIENAKIAIVSYVFGISDVTVNAEGRIVVKASVDRIEDNSVALIDGEGEGETPAEAEKPTFANGVTVALYNGDDLIGEAQVNVDEMVDDSVIAITSTNTLENILNPPTQQDEEGPATPAPTSQTLQLTVKVTNELEGGEAE